MTRNASLYDLKCSTKPRVGCLRSDWAIVPTQIDVSAWSDAFVTGTPVCMAEEFRVPTVCRNDSMSKGNENKPEKYSSVVHEHVAWLTAAVEPRHLAKSRVYRVRSRTSPIFEKSVRDMAGRCTCPLFRG